MMFSVGGRAISDFIYIHKSIYVVSKILENLLLGRKSIKFRFFNLEILMKDIID